MNIQDIVGKMTNEETVEMLRECIVNTKRDNLIGVLASELNETDVEEIQAQMELEPEMDGDV